MGLMIGQQKYQCKFDGGPSQDCTIEEICILRLAGIKDFYTPDKSYSQYVYNWFVELDMTCLSESEMVEFTSMFFVGFAAGLVLFPMPEKLGIKKTMSILMPLFCVFSGLSVFGQSIHVKEVGLFMQGFMHMKIMLAYSHMFELTDETNKGFCAMVI